MQHYFYLLSETGIPSQTSILHKKKEKLAAKAVCKLLMKKIINSVTILPFFQLNFMPST